MSLGKVQKDVGDWFQKAGLELHPQERALRLCEEAFELVQAIGVDPRQVHTLVDYVFNRPVGSAPQEISGVMIGLAALANSLGESIEEVTTQELKRINTPERIERARRRDREKREAGVAFILDPHDEE